MIAQEHFNELAILKINSYKAMLLNISCVIDGFYQRNVQKNKSECKIPTTK